MTPRERLFAALSGQPTDELPGPYDPEPPEQLITNDHAFLDAVAGARHQTS